MKLKIVKISENVSAEAFDCTQKMCVLVRWMKVEDAQMKKCVCAHFKRKENDAAN